MPATSLSECQHPLIRGLNHHSDRELLTLFQRYPDAGKYFVAIFCRYHPLVQTLIRHSVRSPVQMDYLVAVTWRHVFYELGGLDLHEMALGEATGLAAEKPFTLQSWLINMTAVCINRVELPPVESINYASQKASPPLWCYLEQALDRLLPEHRLMVLMAQTFHWSETRISAYLQAEGELIPPREVKRQLQIAYQELEIALPPDIAEIYLGRVLPSPSETEALDLEDLMSEEGHWAQRSEEPIQPPDDDIFSLDPQLPIFENR